MAELAFKFWERVDEIRNNKSLMDIAEGTGIKYQQIRHLRSDSRYPKMAEVFAIASFLGTSVEYLMTGRERHEAESCPEAEYVRKNALARELIKYCMMDEEVLSSCAALARLAAGKRMDDMKEKRG